LALITTRQPGLAKRRTSVGALHDRDMLGRAAASLAAKLAQCIAQESPATVPGLRGDELEGIERRAAAAPELEPVVGQIPDRRVGSDGWRLHDPHHRPRLPQ